MRSTSFDLFLVLYSYNAAICSRHKVLPKCMIWSQSKMRKNGHICTAYTKKSNKNKTPSRECKHLHLQTMDFWEAAPRVRTTRF